MHKILQQAPGKAKHCYASSRHPTLERKKRLIMTGFVPTGRVWPYLPDDNNTSNCILVSPLPPDVRGARVAQWRGHSSSNNVPIWPRVQILELKPGLSLMLVLSLAARSFPEKC